MTPQQAQQFEQARERQAVSIDIEDGAAIAKAKLVVEQAEKDEAYMRLKQRAAKLQAVAEAAEAYFPKCQVIEGCTCEHCSSAQAAFAALRAAGYLKEQA